MNPARGNRKRKEILVGGNDPAGRKRPYIRERIIPAGTKKTESMAKAFRIEYEEPISLCRKRRGNRKTLGIIIRGRDEAYFSFGRVIFRRSPAAADDAIMERIKTRERRKSAIPSRGVTALKSVIKRKEGRETEKRRISAALPTLSSLNFFVSRNAAAAPDKIIAEKENKE